MSRSARRVAEPSGLLVDDSRLVRWAFPLFAGCAVVLLPWIVIVGLTLPSRSLSRNYNVAWAGFDVGLLIGVAATAVAGLRRHRGLPIAASATGAMLLTDAWFDALTSGHGWPLVRAVTMGVFAELPLAVVCFWLAWHAQAVAEQRVVLLLRRTGRFPAGLWLTRDSERPN